MAVKISSYYWFRNNYLVQSLEDEVSERNFFGGKLSSEDRRTLKFIVDELDKLKDDSYFQQGKPVISEHIIIPNVVELTDVTSNPELAAAYLQGIHRIMKKYWVQTELYRQLDRCFDELGLQPSGDVAEAIEYVYDELSHNKYASLNSMCWQTIKEHRVRGI